MMKNSRVLNYKFWIDLFMPNRCPVCGKVIVWNELVCEDCEKALPFMDKPFEASRKIRDDNLDGICAVFKYDGNAVNGIYNLKLQKGLNFAELASEYICRYLRESDNMSKINAVTFVPMSGSKKSKRGYNQAEKIAGFVAKKLDKPLVKDLLIHKPALTEQHKLDHDERQKNAEIVFDFSSKHSDVKGKCILLCDDVITTGATLNRCAELLKQIGAESVYGAAICNTELK